MTLAKKLGIGLLMTSSLVGMTYGIRNMLVNDAQIQRLYGQYEVNPYYRFNDDSKNIKARVERILKSIDVKNEQ